MKHQKLASVLPSLRRFSSKVLFHSHPICSPSVLPSVASPPDIDSLRDSLKLRGMNEEQLPEVQKLHSEHMNLKTIIDDLSFSQKQARNISLVNANLTNVSLREEARSIKSKLSLVKREWKIKHNEFLLSYLKLPNIVDRNHTNVNISLPSFESIDQSGPSDLPKYIHSSLHGCRYLLDALALWERELLDASFAYAQQHFGFIPVHLSDFARAPVVAAANSISSRPTIEATKEETVKVEGSDPFVNPYLLYHLVGSASLEAFLAFFMRNAFKKKVLPLKITAFGRDYSTNGNEAGLQRITQRNLVSYGVVTDCYDKASDAFNELLQHVVTFWKCLSPYCSIEIVSVHPTQLKQYETARLEVIADGKITLAHVSLIGDFLSRRLMIQNTTGENLCLVHGTLINSLDLLDSLVSSNCSLSDLVKMNKRLESALNR